MNIRIGSKPLGSSARPRACLNRTKAATTFLAPSNINYIHSEHYTDVLSEKIDQSILDVADKISVNDQEQPKIQAVEKDGSWFTLNNSQLDLCRRLEMAGKCEKVKVDIVPLTGIPQDILSMMVIPPTTKAHGDKKECRHGDTSRSTSHGYQKLQQGDGDEIKVSDNDDDSDDDSDSSECDDSDSECDWSVDEHDSSDIGTSSDENEDSKNSSQNEEDTLL